MAEASTRAAEIVRPVYRGLWPWKNPSRYATPISLSSHLPMSSQPCGLGGRVSLDQYQLHSTTLAIQISPRQEQELCAHVRPCPPNRLWPDDLRAAGDDPMSKSRLHGFSSHRQEVVRSPACLLTSAYQA